MNINNRDLSGEGLMNISGENTSFTNTQESNNDNPAENVSQQQYPGGIGPIELSFFYPQVQPPSQPIVNGIGPFFQTFPVLPTNLPGNLPTNITMRIVGNQDLLNNQIRRTEILNRLGNMLNANIIIDGEFDEAQNMNQNTFEDALLQSMATDTKRPDILKESVYESWEKKKYEDMSEEFKKENTSCYITFEDYKNDDVVVNMPCGHTMSENAAKDWFRINHKCPFCMKKYESRQMTDEEYQIYRQELEKNNNDQETREEQDDEERENEILATSIDNETEDDNQSQENNTIPDPRFNNNLLQTIIQNTFNRNTYADEFYNRRQEEIELQRAIEESMRIQ